MPLYTYVVSYRGSTHAVQGRYSNYKGFAPTALAQILDGALPARPRRYVRIWPKRGEWAPVPGSSVCGKQAFKSAVTTWSCMPLKRKRSKHWMGRAKRNPSTHTATRIVGVALHPSYGLLRWVAPPDVPQPSRTIARLSP